MSQVVGAVIGALAVIFIPLVAWISRRASREGRLLLRVERLGTAFKLMPNSLEKDAFRPSLTGAIADLNRWLNPENAKRRRLIRRISVWAYSIGVISALIALPSVTSSGDPSQSSTLGIVIGLAISVITIGSEFLVDRSARTKAAQAAKDAEDAETAKRMDALRRGVPLPAVPSKKTIIQ